MLMGTDAPSLCSRSFGVLRFHVRIIGGRV